MEYDQQGVEIAQREQVLEGQANSWINVGIDCQHTREGGNTEAAFREVESIFEHDAWMRWRYNTRLQAAQAEYWLAQGDIARAVDYTSRLMQMAVRYKIRKYIAEAHKLQAGIAVARGDLASGCGELGKSLDVLKAYPCPVAEWKVYADLGRLLTQQGKEAEAKDAFCQAAGIVHMIADNVSDEKLRETFLASTAVREVLPRP
jgi:hypothetical protein